MRMRLSSRAARKEHDIFVENPEWKMPFEDGFYTRILIKLFLEEEDVWWINMAQDRNQWRAF
jgi:hypothetical protein